MFCFVTPYEQTQVITIYSKEKISYIYRLLLCSQKLKLLSKALKPTEHSRDYLWAEQVGEKCPKYINMQRIYA